MESNTFQIKWLLEFTGSLKYDKSIELQNIKMKKVLSVKILNPIKDLL